MPPAWTHRNVVAFSSYLESTAARDEPSGAAERVNTIVVFSDPAVKLKVSPATVPVLYLAELRDYLKRQKPVLSPDVAAAIASRIASLM